MFRRSDYITITQEKVNANCQILHKLQILLCKKKLSKKIQNAHVTMLIVLKNVNSFNFKKKNEVFLKSNATSTKIKKNKISMTLKFSKLISVVYSQKEQLIKFNIKLISIVCSDEKQLIIIIENVIIHVLKRAAAKAIESILLLKQTYCKESIKSLIEFIDFMLSDNQFAIDIRNELIICDENIMIH